jgi:hypothetical protein
MVPQMCNALRLASSYSSSWHCVSVGAVAGDSHQHNLTTESRKVNDLVFALVRGSGSSLSALYFLVDAGFVFQL